MDIIDLSKKIFLEPPKSQNSINIQFENINKTTELFETFLQLFTEGMKIKFGKNEKVNLSLISKEDFNIMEKYFLSMGIKLYYHIYHIQQVEQLENLNQTHLKSEYDIKNRLSEEQLKNFEKLNPDFLINYKKSKSNNLKDLKFQIKIEDLIYVIYFEVF